MMARFTDRNLKQTAVYWGSPATTGSGGFTFAAAVEIPCRWVGSTHLFTTSAGDEVVSRAQVQVKQDLDEQGYLYLGTLDDLTAAQKADPKKVSSAWTIKRFDKVPTMDGRNFFRKAWL